MEEASAEMKCGFCMRKNNTMEDPKVLPCNHVHCFGCLSSFEVNHKLQCPVQGCGKVSSIPLRNLKSFDLMVERDDFCDTCENKEAATIFCLGCSRKFCEKHQQSHDDVLKDHTKIAMSEYREQAAKLEKRTCSIHEYQPYILGCKVCLTIACVQCISGLEECENGGHHMLMSLKELTKMLVEDDRVVVKEEKLEKIFKETSKAQSEYDSETNEMVQLLHKTRDDQLSCIRLKYDLLEAKLLEERAKGKLQLAEFLEDIAISKWTRLRNQRLMIESKERNSHEVDFVKGYKELSESLQKVLEDELPKLEIQDIAQLDDCACSGTKTFCVNFMTGERLWTHEGVSSPPGLTCYGRKYVLVSQSNTNKISILDISSGQKVAELTDRSVATMHPFGMHVTEDRLVVGNYNGSTMRFYQLNYD
ncbi:transcription intermediary factor 1-beta-like isoform X3 [Watersipora subatra]|uniref:transcription intermediary factor 1-beta-like isoform X3 n=1 Tax=Watersipora subatra TaxID=2589382 RepID=UPI00355BAD80